MNLNVAFQQKIIFTYTLNNVNKILKNLRFLNTCLPLKMSTNIWPCIDINILNPIRIISISSMLSYS